MSKARALLLLVAIGVALLTAVAMDGDIGAVVSGALLLVVLVAGFVTLAMNMGQYDWATEVIGKIIDPIVARVRTFVRKAWPPT